MYNDHISRFYVLLQKDLDFIYLGIWEWQIRENGCPKQLKQKKMLIPLNKFLKLLSMDSKFTLLCLDGMTFHKLNSVLPKAESSICHTDAGGKLQD